MIYNVFGEIYVIFFELGRVFGFVYDYIFVVGIRFEKKKKKLWQMQYLMKIMCDFLCQVQHLVNSICQFL